MGGSTEAGALAVRRAELLAWFDRFRRPLPWRRDRDPYRVWVSEVMLQQTRVDVVIPFYQRFLEAYPTVESLAAAPEDEVIARWSGLGYYRRARSLSAAARRVVEAGGFPERRDGWLELPGVGPYTAAAVTSIVYGERVPAVDGNVERVISRVAAQAQDPRTAAGRRMLEAAALEWLDPARPGDGNQALMELGATVCRPRDPLCPECPLEKWCRARGTGEVERFPIKRRRPARTRHRLTAFLVCRGDRVVLFKRSSRAALLAGTWELPWVEAEAEPEPTLAELYGGRWSVGERLGDVRHSITHRDLEIEIRGATWTESSELAEAPAAGPGEAPEVRWAGRRELDQLPHSSLVCKVLDGVSEDGSVPGVGSISPPASRNQPTSFS